MRARNTWLVLQLLAAASCAPAVERDDAGALTAAAVIEVFELRVGDCFDDADLFESGDVADLTRVAGVPCSEPHDNEVYAVAHLTPDDFPGEEEVAEAAFALCLDRFEAFAGESYETSSLAVLPVYPTRDSWSRAGDRAVVCAARDSQGRKLEGTARNGDI